MNNPPLYPQNGRAQPLGEDWQSNFYKGYHWADAKSGEPNPDRGFRRTAIREMPFVEFDPTTNRWMQGPLPMGRDFKPTKYWARPVDGQRRGTWGRLLDGLTNQGPDVFVVLNGDRRTLMRDMPHRAQWSKWGGPKWDVNYNSHLWDPDATLGERVHYAHRNRNSEWYNFRTRTYEGRRNTRKSAMQNALWTDAHWNTNGPQNRFQIPLSYRDGFNEMHTNVPLEWAQQYAGGRPMNR